MLVIAGVRASLRLVNVDGRPSVGGLPDYRTVGTEAESDPSVSSAEGLVLDSCTVGRAHTEVSVLGLGTLS